MDLMGEGVNVLFSFKLLFEWKYIVLYLNNIIALKLMMFKCNIIMKESYI